jgi:hypothetical protein
MKNGHVAYTATQPHRGSCIETKEIDCLMESAVLQIMQSGPHSRYGLILKRKRRTDWGKKSLVTDAVISPAP